MSNIPYQQTVEYPHIACIFIQNLEALLLMVSEKLYLEMTENWQTDVHVDMSCRADWEHILFGVFFRDIWLNK